MVRAKNIITEELSVKGEVKVNGIKKDSKGRGRKRNRESSEDASSKKIKVSLNCPDIKNGVVLSVGTGDIGQLGLGPDIEEKMRPCMIPDLADVVSIAAGGLHSLCLTKDGKVYSWGCNDEGALGRPTTSDEENFCIKQIELSETIVQISAGDCHSAALTSEGRVFAWGSFRDNSGPLGFVERGTIQKSPREILRNVPIVKITSGNNHLALLSQEGKVYTCGCGECGQLGRLAECFAGRDRRNHATSENLLEPLPLKVFKSRKAVVFDEVWTGGYATFLRAKDSGDIYGCGLNNYCQLGNEDTNMKFQPLLLKAFKGKKWSQMSGGQHHSVALDCDGNVFSMGRYDYGRLGLGEDTKDAIIPTKVAGIEGKAVEVSSGECVSFAVTEDGKAYGFGMGTNNQLGQGNEDDQFSPALILGKQLQERNVISVKSGGQHTTILAVPK